MNGMTRRELLAKVPAIAATAAIASRVTLIAPRVAAASTHIRIDEAIGTSVQGNQIVASRLVPVAASRRVVVVGAIHGNEYVGASLVDALLARTDLPADLELVGVRALNPDGAAAGTRRNARGVDLNRNFPVAWGLKTAGMRTGDAGQFPLSEPEAASIAAMCTSMAASMPTVFVWVHSPLGWVAPIGPDPAAGWHATQWARAARLRLRRVTRVPGGAETFCATLPSPTESGTAGSVLVEAKGWGIDPSRHVDGFRAAFG